MKSIDLFNEAFSKNSLQLRKNPKAVSSASTRSTNRIAKLRYHSTKSGEGEVFGDTRSSTWANMLVNESDVNEIDANESR